MEKQTQDLVASQQSALQVSTNDLTSNLEIIISSLAATAITSSSIRADLVSYFSRVQRIELTFLGTLI